MTDRERKVLEAIAATGDNGLTASQIVRESWNWGTSLRVWSAQSAAAIARGLAHAGYVRPVRWRQLTYYKATSMGYGYLSV
jgi:hypothetical protein